MSRADADVVIKLDVRDGEAQASLTAFEARLKRLDSAGGNLSKSFRDVRNEIDEMSDALAHFDKSVKNLDTKALQPLDKELNQKQKDLNKTGKAAKSAGKDFDKTGKDVDNLTNKFKKGNKDGNFFKQLLGGIGKFAKLAGIEFLALSASVGGLNLALKAGQLVMKGWQYALKGVGIAAGSAVAALAGVLAAIREYQFAMMMPAFKVVGTPMAGPTNARSRYSGFMGASPGLGVFSDKAITGSLSSAMGNGQKVNPQLMAMMRTLGNYAVASGDPEKSLPGLMAAFTKAQQGGGKITKDVYTQIQSQSPYAAKVFEELAGGPKKLEAALSKGTLTVDQFMKAFRDGTMDSVKPFLGALDEVNNTLIGRFKNIMKQTREQLIGIGDPIVEGLKGPLESAGRDVRVFLTRITSVVQSTFSDIGGGDLLGRALRGLATLINTNLPKIKEFGSDIRKAFNWSKNLFSNIGDYIRSVTGGASGLWENIFKPIGSEFLKTIDYALKSFNNLMSDTEPYAKNFKGYIESIGEGVRRLIDGMGNIKRVLAPIIDSLLRLFQVFSSILNLGGGVGSVVSTGLMGLFAGRKIFGGVGGGGGDKDGKGGVFRYFYNQGNKYGKNADGSYRNPNSLMARRMDARREGYNAEMMLMTNRQVAADAQRRGMVFDDSYGGYVPKGTARAQTLLPDHENRIDARTWRTLGVHQDAMGNYVYSNPKTGQLVTLADDADKSAFMDKYGRSKEELLGRVGGYTHAQGYAAAGASLTSEDQKMAIQAGRLQGRAFLKSTVREWGAKTKDAIYTTVRGAAPMVAGVAMTAAGGYLSSRVDGANQAGQAGVGALAMGGQGAMLGAQFGPWGALIGGAGGALIGGVMGWMNAGKEQEKRVNAAGERARDIGTSNIVRNNRASIALQIAENEKRVQDYGQYGDLESNRAELEKQINAYINGSEDIRKVYRTAGMKYDDWWQGTENIFDSFKDSTTVKKLQSLADSGLFSADQTKKIEEYIEATKKTMEVNDTAGRSEEERQRFISETNKLNDELRIKQERFNANLGILGRAMNLNEEASAQLAEQLNIDLAESFVTMSDIIRGLGYTTDEFANRATAAGRLMDNLLSVNDPRKKAIESETELFATGQALFNTPNGGFASTQDAQMAAINFGDALLSNLTAKRTDKNDPLYKLSAKEYQAEIARQFASYYQSGLAQGIDPTALAELKRYTFGDSVDGGDAAGRSYNNAGGRGIVGTVSNAGTSYSDMLQYDEKFATGMEALMKDAATQASNAAALFKARGGEITADGPNSMKGFAERAMNEVVLGSGLFKGSGLDGNQLKDSFTGMVLGEMQSGVQGVENAFLTGSQQMADALAKTTLKVDGAVTGTVAIVEGGDTASVKFHFTSGGSSGSGGGGGRGVDSPNGDTTSSRWMRTLSSHNRFNSMLPGSRTVTSGVRNHNLGSMMSDHRFGRAYDLTGDNLGQYSKMVNDAGGFAEMHGAAGGRHLHVVPPAGDSANPALTGGGAGTVNNYNISVSAGDVTSANQIAQMVMREIRRTERSDRERR